MLYLGVRCYASLVGDRQYNASNQKTDPLLLELKRSTSNIKNSGLPCSCGWLRGDQMEKNHQRRNLLADHISDRTDELETQGVLANLCLHVAASIPAELVR